MRHEGSEVYQGFLATYDVDYNYSVVKVKTFLDVNVGLIEHAVGILPDGKVVALGRGTCGELMARSVMLADDLSVCEDIKDPVSSMLNITKVQLHYDMSILICFCCALNCIFEGNRKMHFPI